MRKYKDTLVGKASALNTALQNNNKKEAEKVYKETSARYAAMFSKEDRDWFLDRSKV